MTELEAFAKYPNCGYMLDKSVIMQTYVGSTGLNRIVMGNDDGTFVHMEIAADNATATSLRTDYVPVDTTDKDLKALTETARCEYAYPKQHLMSRGAVAVDCYKDVKGNVVVVYRNPDSTYYHMELNTFRG